MTGYEITKSMLKDYKGTSLKEYKQNKSKRAFEKVYRRLKRYITLWSLVLAVTTISLATQIYA
jgi:hypothetical protein